jgi:hypothetical protein
VTVWCADAKICIRFGAVHTLPLYRINLGISGVCSLDDSGQKIDTQFPLTTKSASRAPHSVQR